MHSRHVASGALFLLSRLCRVDVIRVERWHEREREERRLLPAEQAVGAPLRGRDGPFDVRGAADRLRGAPAHVRAPLDGVGEGEVAGECHVEARLDRRHVALVALEVEGAAGRVGGAVAPAPPDAEVGGGGARTCALSRACKGWMRGRCADVCAHHDR